MMKKLLIIVGTRPNYIKITRFKTVADSLFKGQFDIKIVHTGQHFDKEMAEVFFQQLNIQPDYFLNIPQASANTQIAEIMLRLEKVLEEYKPDWVIVPGDVNSTVAAAMCVQKCGFKLLHLESGLRSFDSTMPEEINRIVTDQLSDLFFVTEQSGIENLLKEKRNEKNIFFVGNTMIDTLVAFDEQIRFQNTYLSFGLTKGKYVLITMHRPSNVDSYDGLKNISVILNQISKKFQLVFPIHPRTKKKLITYNLWDELTSNKNIIFTDSLNYFDFQNLILHCKFVVTDSGGVQEETTYRQIPCLTLRPNTERPITITEGTNTLITFSQLEKEMNKIIEGEYKVGIVPKFWDGKSTIRILEVMANQLLS